MCILNKTAERESPQEAHPAWENSSLGFIKAVQKQVLLYLNV